MTLNSTEVTLEKIRYALCRTITEDEIRLAREPDVVIDDFCREIAYRVSVQTVVVALERERLRIDEIDSALTPASSWDALKACLAESKWTRWMARIMKAPAYREIVVEVHVDEPRYSHVCPHLELDDHRKHLQFFAPMSIQDDAKL